MAYLYRILILLSLFCFPAIVLGQAAQVGSVDLAGWVRGADGSYSRAYADNSGIRTTPTNTTLNSTSTALVQTSKGLQSIEIVRTAAVDVSRVGKAVRGLAVLGGPLGMTVTAVSLVCELTNICNEAGQWVAGGVDPMPGAPNSYPVTDGKWFAWGNRYTYSAESACRDTERLTINIGAGSTYDHMEAIDANTYRCYGKHPNGNVFYASNTSRLTNQCPDGYQLQGSDCVKTGVTQSHPATASDWDSKQQLLNDSRFTPELNEKGADIPTGVPTLTGNPKKVISEETVPTKDQNGNITGSRKTTVEAEIVDGATSDNPSRVIVRESTTINNYDINNTLINSATSTNYTNQPEKQSIEIKFDEVPPATMQTYNVPNTFTSTSWGSGSCPPDIEVATTNITFSIPTQPVCDTAEMINPFVLLLSALIGIYIISGVRGANAA